LAWPKSGETLHPPKKKKQFAVRFRRLKMKPTHSFSLCIGCQVFFKWKSGDNLVGKKKKKTQ
jgi:hypothetical protein